MTSDVENSYELDYVQSDDEAPPGPGRVLIKWPNPSQARCYHLADSEDSSRPRCRKKHASQTLFKPVSYEKYATHLPICKECSGQYEPSKKRNPMELVQKLSDADPRELGLSARFDRKK